MATDDEEILAEMRAALVKARGYADHFGWATDRDLEEWSVARLLIEALDKDGLPSLTNLKRRGRPNDPPDCEALDFNGQRVAIEVTELVDADAIRKFKASRIHDPAEWTKDKFLHALTKLITSKEARFPNLKGQPYGGGYHVVIFTAESNISMTSVEEWLSGHCFHKNTPDMRVFIILSYKPEVKKYPYWELNFN